MHASKDMFEALNTMEISPDFISRIQKRTGWNLATAKAVDFEYRCFLLLSAISQKPVTPPDAVDDVWHEHILYTRHYFEVLPTIIGKTLHHDPGGITDLEKHRSQYRYTWQLYRTVFGREPTRKIWPLPKKRITDLFRRKDNVFDTEDLSTAWLALAAQSSAYDTETSSHSKSYTSSHNFADSTDIASCGSSSDCSSASSCGSSCGGGCGGD